MEYPSPDFALAIRGQIRRDVADPLIAEHGGRQRRPVHLDHKRRCSRPFEDAVYDAVLVIRQLNLMVVVRDRYIVAVTWDGHVVAVAWDHNALRRDRVLVLYVVDMGHVVDMVEVVRVCDRVAVPGRQRVRVGHQVRMLRNRVAVAAHRMVMIHPMRVLLNAVVMASRRMCMAC